MKPIVFNKEQVAMVDAIIEHLQSPDKFLICEGPAGSGKTSCLLEALRRLPNVPMIMTGPTNKSVRVIRGIVGHSVPTRTIYSLLGLVMVADGEVKSLQGSGDGVDLNDFQLVVVDEGSMLNSVIWHRINLAAQAYPSLRWVLMGDRDQLNPVEPDSILKNGVWFPNPAKGQLSPIWKVEKRAQLVKVERHDNQILTLATHVREVLHSGGPIVLEDSHTDHGVWKGSMKPQMLKDAEAFRTGESKALAWRNATVAQMNKLIRAQLVENPDEAPYQVGERITALEPIKDFNDNIVASTDEEFTVMYVNEVRHPIYKNFVCWRLAVETDDEEQITLFVPHEKSERDIAKHKARLAAEAKESRPKWKYFWSFVESWHSIRHAYAQTVHRAQGSTYDRAYVDWRDILVNRDRNESLRCLYVGVSRPRFDLYI